MTIVLTGGSGFIGQHLIPMLAGHELRIISRNDKPPSLPLNIKWIKADLADKEGMREAFSNADILINLAAELRKENSFYTTNITGSKNLIELCIDNKVKKIIHLSSVGVVGKQYSLNPFSVNEETICHPQNGYEKSKYESENLFKAVDNIQVIILRPTNVFGDNHPRNVLLHFMKRVRKNKLMFCSRTARVNYVYVKDLADLVNYFVNDSFIENSVFNVGHDMSFNEFYKKCCDAAGVNTKIIYLPRFIFAFLNFIGYFGIKKIGNVFKSVSNHVRYEDKQLAKFLVYKYGVDKGIEFTFASYKNKGLL